MTVNEYRKKHPDCEYCKHSTRPVHTCLALNKRKSKRRAKKCPCYKGKAEVAKEIFKELDQELAYCLESHPYAVSRYFEIRDKYTKRGEYESN